MYGSTGEGEGVMRGGEVKLKLCLNGTLALGSRVLCIGACVRVDD